MLDQLWQTKEQVTGRHVDENWHEFGVLEYDMAVDVELATACIEESSSIGVKSKAVNYDGFPIDTGTIVANSFLNRKRKPVVVTSNNVYHDMAVTESIGQLVAKSAREQRKDIAVVAVGGLSGAFFRQEINPEDDRIFSEAYDSANRKMLDLICSGNCQAMAFVPSITNRRALKWGSNTLVLSAGLWAISIPKPRCLLDRFMVQAAR